MIKIPQLKISKAIKKELYRKALHLSSLWIPLFIYLAHPGVSIIFFSALFIGNAIIEYGNYKKYPWARKTFGNIFFRILRNKETTHGRFQISGSLYVILAAIGCTLMFSKSVAVISLSVMLVSDTAAAIIGKLYGQRKIYKHKTLEGSLAFFLSALLINMLCEPIYHFSYAGVIASAAATFTEIFEDKVDIDDNLSIPVVVGVILSILN